MIVCFYCSWKKLLYTSGIPKRTCKKEMFFFFYTYVCCIMSLLDYYICYAATITAGHLMMEHAGFGMLDIPSLIHAYTYPNRLKQLLVSYYVYLLAMLLRL